MSEFTPEKHDSRNTLEPNAPFDPASASPPAPAKKKGWLIARALEALFIYSGRTTRLEFIAALPLLFLLAGMCFLFITGVGSDLASQLLFYAVAAIPAALLQEKRLYDMGLSRLPSVLIALAVPILPLLLYPLPALANFPWRYALIGWVVLLATVPSRRPE